MALKTRKHPYRKHAFLAVFSFFKEILVKIEINTQYATANEVAELIEYLQEQSWDYRTDKSL